MYALGLKLWTPNIDHYLHEAQHLYDAGIFDYIELYVVPETLDYLHHWKKLKIPFDIHAPHFRHKFNLSKPEMFDFNKKCYAEVAHYADALNTELIVFHGGTDGRAEETARQLAFFQESRSVLENKPYITVPEIQGNHYVGASFEEISMIMEVSGCGFCLDIGHGITAANALGYEPYTYIKKLFSLHPRRIHLSDLDTTGVIDQHLHYGDGNLDFKKLLTCISPCNHITIETNKDSKYDLNDYKNDVSFLKKILKDMG